VSINPEITRLIDEIRNNRTDGASQLARQAVAVLKTVAERSQVGNSREFLLEQMRIGERLMSARPAMAPLCNIVSRLLNRVATNAEGLDLDSIKPITLAKADELIKDSLEAVARVAQFGSELIAGGDTIMTHSYSSTVVAALKQAFNKHRDIEVIVTRSGPGRTGERIAQQLGADGTAVTFIDDAAVGLYISTASKIMVGADRICADGGVVNGIGTYQLALAAEKAGVPCYVLCETLKFDPRLNSDEVTLEEKEAWEVVAPGVLPRRVKVKNPYFDITPRELVTGIVTENGLLTPEKTISYRQVPPNDT